MNDYSKNGVLIERAKKVKLLLMDCDGVMTDGRLYFTTAGEEMKVFNVRDGQGISDWHRAGFKSGVISGRGAEGILKKRFDELGMEFLKTDSKNKGEDLVAILESCGLSREEVAFIGDDRGDIDVLSLVGFPVAVGDAISELDDFVIYKTEASGGKGAVRELIDLLLKLKAAG
jgi:3-deoxy-D-manno-octulosonate 8-phosphate phosphatase (KDO 8-P phosphatase)